MKHFTSLTTLFALFATTLAMPQGYYPPPANSTSTPVIRPSTTSSATVLEPTSTSPSDPASCETAAVYICEDVNWGGNCTLHHPCIGGGDATCYQLDGKASSIGPDPGFECTFYKNGVCRDFGEGRLKLQYPGASNMMLVETVQGEWNDAVMSFQCFEL